MRMTDVLLGRLLRRFFLTKTLDSGEGCEI